jgi:predicted CoA-binding protein
MLLETDADIAALLAGSRRIAMVGASAKPQRASNGVMRWLLDHGFDVIPVNPLLAGETIHGKAVVADLAAIGGEIDIVDIFRASEQAGAAVDEAIAAGARAVWLQLGVIDPDAAVRAAVAGLAVVMDRCIKIEASRLGVSAPR